MNSELTLHIVGEDLNNIDFGERATGERFSLYIGIQKGQEVVDLVPVTAPSATFTATLRVELKSEGPTNFLGPYAHGPLDARFCYLSWLTENEAGERDVFGRVKLPLSSLLWERVEEAMLSGTPITLHFSLCGKNNKPVFASVPSNAVRWQ